MITAPNGVDLKTIRRMAPFGDPTDLIVVGRLLGTVSASIYCSSRSRSCTREGGR